MSDTKGNTNSNRLPTKTAAVFFRTYRDVSIADEDNGLVRKGSVVFHIGKFVPAYTMDASLSRNTPEGQKHVFKGFTVVETRPYVIEEIKRHIPWLDDDEKSAGAKLAILKEVSHPANVHFDAKSGTIVLFTPKKGVSPSAVLLINMVKPPFGVVGPCYRFNVRVKNGEFYCLIVWKTNGEDILVFNSNLEENDDKYVVFHARVPQPRNKSADSEVPDDGLVTEDAIFEESSDSEKDLESTEIHPEIYITLSAEKIMAKVEASEWSAQAVSDLEKQRKPKPRIGLTAELKKLLAE